MLEVGYLLIVAGQAPEAPKTIEATASAIDCMLELSAFLGYRT